MCTNFLKIDLYSDIFSFSGTKYSAYGRYFKFEDRDNDFQLKPTNTFVETSKLCYFLYVTNGAILIEIYSDKGKPPAKEPIIEPSTKQQTKVQNKLKSETLQIYL